MKHMFVLVLRGNKELEEVKASLGNLLKELEQIRATLTVHIDVSSFKFTYITAGFANVTPYHCPRSRYISVTVFVCFERTKVRMCDDPTNEYE